MTKSDGSLCLCIDPQALNKALRREVYPLPTVDDVLPEMAKAKVFSRFDVKSAFWYCKLDEESRDLTTFATPYGRFRCIRMPFGLKVSSEIFQKKFNEAFLKRCREKEISLNLSKSLIRLQEMTFSDHKFTTEGLRVDEIKVKAINEMPRPENKKDVQHFVGMMNYLARFCKNLSEVIKPIRDLEK